jgi:hypothetical protein
MNRPVLTLLTICSFAGAASALAPAAKPAISTATIGVKAKHAACRAHAFKAQLICSEQHVNPQSVQIGTCGSTQVASISQSGVAGVTLVDQIPVKLVPNAHPGMSSTYTGPKFNLYVNRTVQDDKGNVPADLTFGTAKAKKLSCKAQQ